MERQRKLKQDVFTSLWLMLLSVIVVTYLIPNYIADVSVAGMSPQFFPFVGAVSIGVFSLWLFLFSVFSLSVLKKHHVESESLCKAKSQQTDHAMALSVSQLKLSVMAFVVLLVFCVLFEMVGYFVAAPLAIFGLMFVFGQRNASMLLVFPLIVSGTLFLVFEYGLNLPLQ